MAASLPITLVNGNALHLPVRGKFNPSEEDLVVRYLRPRAFNQRLPSADIREAKITRSNPWDLVPEGANEMYFLAQKELKYNVGTRLNRAAREGYWRGSGLEAPVYAKAAGHGMLVGMRRTLVFYRGNAPIGECTEWAMQEYRLAGAGLSPCWIGTNNLDPSGGCAATSSKRNNALTSAPAALPCPPRMAILVAPDDSWIVCRIYKKRRHVSHANTKATNAWEGTKVPFIDFLGIGNRVNCASEEVASLDSISSYGKDENNGGEKKASNVIDGN